MVALDHFWPRRDGEIRSITREILSAIFVSAFLTSLVIALRVSVACMTITAGELWQIIVTIFAAPTGLIGCIIVIRVRQMLARIELMHQEVVNSAMIDGLTGLLNRSGFDAVAAEALEEARRWDSPSQRSCAISMPSAASMTGTGTRLEIALSKTLPTCSKSRSGVVPQSSADRAAMSFWFCYLVLTSRWPLQLRKVFARPAKRAHLLSRTRPRSSRLALAWQGKHRAHSSLEGFLGKRRERSIGPREPAETKSRRELGGSFIAV